MGVAVGFLRPDGDGAAAVQARAQIHRHARPVGLPGVFVLAGPFQQDRHAGIGAGHQHGIEGRVVGAIMAVAPGARHVMNRDCRFRQVQRPGHGGAQDVDALAVRPDGEFPVLPQRGAGGWSDRCVHVVGALILRGQGHGGIGRRFHDGRQRRFLRRAVGDRQARALIAAQPFEYVLGFQPLAPVPVGGVVQSGGRGQRGVFIGARDREEAAVANNPDAV